MKQLCLFCPSILLCLLLSACGTDKAPNQKLAAYVDLENFMGTWYVHGYTPTAIDKDAWNATESYELQANGKIRTTYQFNKGSFDGKLKTFNPVGKVTNSETNAEWKMRFFGLITSAYYIVYIDPNYQYTIIGHPNKEMAWIMSRNSEILDAQYNRLVGKLEARSYDLSALKRVLHNQSTRSP